MAVTGNLDAKDLKLLEILEANARTSTAELARAIGIERTACRHRLQRLKDRGFVKRFTIERGGSPVEERPPVQRVEYVLVGLRKPSSDQTLAALKGEIEEYVATSSAVSWAGLVTGEYGYLIRIAEREAGQIAKFLIDLGKIRGVSATLTVTLLSELQLASK